MLSHGRHSLYVSVKQAADSNELAPDVLRLEGSVIGLLGDIAEGMGCDLRLVAGG
jgi:hypothetical protein